MKHIAALLLATAALLTLSETQADERWGWSDIGPPAYVAATREDTWAPVNAVRTYVGESAGRVDIVPLRVEPALTRAPSALSAALPQFDEAVDAIRAVVAQDPLLVTRLRARGFDPNDVVGLTHSASGKVTLFVTDQV